MVVDILILCYDLIGSDNMIVERDYLAGPSGSFMVHVASSDSEVGVGSSGDGEGKN